MRSIMTRIATIGFAALVVGGAVGSAGAQTRYRHGTAPYQSEYMDQSQAAARERGPVYDDPNTCVTDQGYGRVAPCDQGGGD